jgi:hypothetical protein
MKKTELVRDAIARVKELERFQKLLPEKQEDWTKENWQAHHSITNQLNYLNDWLKIA